jgi:excisionase family DNA binding protein
METKIDQPVDPLFEPTRIAATLPPEVVAGLFLDGTQAARLLLVSRTHIYKLIGRGVITPYKIGALTVFWRPQLLEAIEARRRAYEAGKEWNGR